MPIKPENRHRYPPDWKKIRSARTIAARAVPTFPENCDPSNLRAWCQRCHLVYEPQSILVRRLRGQSLAPTSPSSNQTQASKGEEKQVKTLKKKDCKPGMQIRHGDTFMQVVAEIPADAVPVKTNVLAEGEATGHAHRFEAALALEPDAFEMLASADGRLWFRAKKAVVLTHEEHEHVKIPAGVCAVCGIGPNGLGGRTQREWSPEGERRVMD